MNAILIAALIAAVALLIFERAKLKNLEAQARLEKEKLVELERQNRGLDVRLKMIAKMNAEFEQKLAVLEGEKAELTRRLRTSEEQLRKIKDLAQAMTPDDMVQTTRRILQDSGVEKIDVGARFSLSAFRKNTQLLLEWEEFSLVKIPTLNKKAEILEKENLNLQNQILLWKEADRLWRQKNNIWLEEKLAMNRLISNYERQLGGQKRQKIVSFALGLLAGFGAHALLR